MSLNVGASATAAKAGGKPRSLGAALRVALSRVVDDAASERVLSQQFWRARPTASGAVIALRSSLSCPLRAST
jgi:hypothetical protein